jgi:hypothetical protein
MQILTTKNHAKAWLAQNLSRFAGRHEKIHFLFLLSRKEDHFFMLFMLFMVDSCISHDSVFSQQADNLTEEWYIYQSKK